MTCSISLKIEAGKVEVRPTEFSVAGLFSAVRGMLRPLPIAQTVNLAFEEPDTKGRAKQR